MLSLTDNSGVDVGSIDRNMAYLYGLSDFFSFIFEDTDVLNLMMEANAIQASDIYSRFLQLTSSITLSDIQETIDSTIDLVLLTEADKIDILPKYRVNKPIQAIKYIGNRPFLPTEFLENGIDFRIIQDEIGSCIIQFAKPLSSYKFSSRVLQGGDTQYALWLMDVKIDEQLMYKHYGKILGVNPEVSSEQFSNFIYGLYYLYVNGPSLRVMEQGLNLVLGIPIPRGTSEVLDIRFNSDENKYVIITDIKQYILPKGIVPTVQIGDLITLGNPIAKWVELKDFTSDGKWWLNVSIPESIISYKPLSQTDRFAKVGSRFDDLMTRYLYRNTFLIRINVGSFTDNKYFSYIGDIISKAKPIHTQPVFVWQVDMYEEEFGLIEEIDFTITQIAAILRSINFRPINTLTLN